MLELTASSNENTIETKTKNIEIVFEEENNLSISIGIPSADKLKSSHCASIPIISLQEVCSRDPFNFNDIIVSELSNYKKKYDRFKDSPTFISKFAGLATLTGDLDTAEKILTQRSDNSKNIFLTQSLGNLFILKGDHRKALEVFSNPQLDKDVFSNLKIAYIKAKSNDKASTQKYLDRALAIDPSDYRTRMFSGAMHLNNGECEKAIRDFRVANEQKEDSSALHVNLAAAHWSLGHTKKAIKELNKAIAINPLNENAIIFYSDALFTLNEYDKPIKALEYFSKLDEKSEFVWERLARSYYFSNKYLKAKNALEKQIALCDDPSVWNNLGLVNWKLKDGKKAISYLYHSLDKSKSNPEKSSYPILNLAAILNEIGKHKECISFVDGFNGINSSDVGEDIKIKIYTQLLIALEATNKYEDLTSKIEILIDRRELKSDQSLMLLYIYKIYSDTVIKKSLAETCKSIDLILQLVDRNKKSFDKDDMKLIFNNICFSLIYFDKIKDAESHLHNIINHVHIDPFCTATFGLYKIKNGDLENGRKLYEEAVSLSPKINFKSKIRQRMYLEIGKYHLTMRDSSKAIKFLRQSLKENYGHHYAFDEAKYLLKLIS